MSDYCEMPEFYGGSWPIARKEHICCECSAPIFKGEKYGCFTGKWPGDGVQTYRQHLKCEEACRYIRDVHLGECIGFGQLFEFVGEYLHLERPAKDDGFRSIMAEVKWRAKKKRPLFFKTRHQVRDDLAKDRARGWV